MVNKLKRLMKELGLYRVYIEDRKITGHEDPFNIANDIGKENSFSHLIDCSFCWESTRHDTMWRELCLSTNAKWAEVLNDRCEMQRLKEIVNIYIHYDEDEEDIILDNDR